MQSQDTQIDKYTHCVIIKRVNEEKPGVKAMLEREAMAVLVSAMGISYGRREMALRAAGSATAVLSDPMAYTPQLSPGGASAIRQMIRSGGIERTLEELERKHVKLVMRGEAGYPRRLMEIPNPPHMLFVWGDGNLDDAFSLGVVGTRKATEYGLSQTRAIACGLAQAGMCIVSGLALGIDAAAHRGALDASGRTVAVLGGALDKFYPAQNRSLMHAVIGSGGSVITEYPLGMAPSKYSFLHRNRIIAGMALGVLVTEGAKRSGALRTAENALDYGREVFALPGDVRSEGSQLPHMLIRDGAQLCTCAADILGALTIEPPEGKRIQVLQATDSLNTEDVPAAAPEQTKPEAPKKRTMPDGLGEEETAIWQILARGECDFDELSEESGIGSEELGALLTMMELDGLIDALAGLRYRLA